ADLADAGRRRLLFEPVQTFEKMPPQIASQLSRPLTGYLAHLADHHGQLYTILGTAAPPIPAQWRIPTALDRDFALTELAWSVEAAPTVRMAVAAVPSARAPIFRRRSIAPLLRFRPGVATDPSSAVKIPLAQLLQLSYVPDPMPFAFAARRIRIVDGAAGWRA